MLTLLRFHRTWQVFDFLSHLTVLTKCARITCCNLLLMLLIPRIFAIISVAVEAASTVGNLSLNGSASLMGINSLFCFGVFKYLCFETL